VTAAHETINEARASIWNAVKIDPGPGGRRALEGDVESAYDRLAEAREALQLDDLGWARRAVDEALELLRTDESRCQGPTRIPTGGQIIPHGLIGALR